MRGLRLLCRSILESAHNLLLPGEKTSIPESIGGDAGAGLGARVASNQNTVGTCGRPLPPPRLPKFPG